MGEHSRRRDHAFPCSKLPNSLFESVLFMYGSVGMVLRNVALNSGPLKVTLWAVLCCCLDDIMEMAA